MDWEGEVPVAIVNKVGLVVSLEGILSLFYFYSFLLLGANLF